MKFKSHEEYLAKIPEETREKLIRIQTTVESVLPNAARCISYNMPAFRQERVFFYFAAFEKHIGIYPPVKIDKRLIRELEPYRGPKGNLVFPLDKPLPIEIIGRVAQALCLEYGSRR